MDVSCVPLEHRLSDKQKPWFVVFADFPDVTSPTNLFIYLLFFFFLVKRAKCFFFFF